MVPAFAVASLLAFALIGAAISFLTVRTVRAGAEEMAIEHARFVAGSVLAPMFEGVDLSRPVTGRAYERLRGLVERSVISERDVRVKIWAPDGTIVFSDLPELVGERFPEEVPELREVLEGGVRAEVSDLSAAEEREERLVADRLFTTYLPFRLGPGGEVTAVAELYQDAAVVQEEVQPLARTLGVGFAVGLVVLYAAILPLAVRASRELRHRNRHLREQAEQLAALLSREQETVARLTELNRVKDDLVAAVSHELRTPLTAIIGYLRTLRRPGFGDRAEIREEFLGASELQARRLFRLIRNLLAAAGLEHGDRPLERTPVDLAALAASAREEFPEAGDRIRLAVPPLPAVETDPARLSHALLNLLDNALKYSPDGSPVEVGARIEGEELRLWVRDRGVGIDPELRPRAFEPFVQGDQSSTRRFGGLGLGLHVVRGLVEELGGRVVLSSQPGAGTTVTVALPLRLPAARRPAVATRSG
ncbi:MAG TPA: HAMP domain-containing sensor histidine kinase [Actinomycetota bacterium]|nr:HAMP domain-containing sensor histidine kinase [Actinomycetota bacterium]